MRLNSWKEVATYLEVSVRTAQRWETLEQLPVHRHQHEKLGSIHAYRSDLDLWREARTRAIGRLPSADGGPNPAGTTLAVLPFANLTREEEGEVLADGLTEELIVALGRITGVRVVARTSSFHFKARSADIRTVGKELGVANVLEGSLRRAGRQLRVVAQLVQVEDGLHVWSDRFDRIMDNDPLALQDELAGKIAEGLQLHFKKHRPSGKISEAAYQLYLKGRFYWNQRTTKALELAAECFTRVIHQHPDFAPAHAALADYHVFEWAYCGRPFKEVERTIEQALLRALESGPELSEVHTSAGLARAGAWDFGAAEDNLRRAISLNPSDSQARHWLAMILANTDRMDEGLNEIGEALAFDPLAASVIQDAGRIHYMRGEYDVAIDYLTRALGMNSEALWSRIFLGLSYLESGRPDQALETFSEDQVMTAAVYARLGQTREARWALEATPAVEEATWTAIAQMSLGDCDKAVASLNRAWEQHEMALQALCLGSQPLFKPLRSYRSFRELVTRMWGRTTARTTC